MITGPEEPVSLDGLTGTMPGLGGHLFHLCTNHDSYFIFKNKKKLKTKLLNVLIPHGHQCMPVSSHMSYPLARFSGDVTDCLDDDVLLDNSTVLLSRKPFSGKTCASWGKQGEDVYSWRTKSGAWPWLGARL